MSRLEDIRFSQHRPSALDSIAEARYYLPELVSENLLEQPEATSVSRRNF